ncbi:MAG: ubiquinol-cytochrome c reductase iron-sulfur subunit [Candidatus Hydrogenedentota bacterium]
MFGGPSTVFALNPLRMRQSGQALNLGSVWNYGETFRLVKHERTVQDGWQSTSELVKLFVRVDADGNPEVFSATCTHLGCSVNWHDEAGEFECPCHGGRYAADGTMIAGPPPASLPRIDARVENEELVIEL